MNRLWSFCYNRTVFADEKACVQAASVWMVRPSSGSKWRTVNTDCVMALGGNDGAEACKPHVVVFGVDVVVKTGVWATCTWDWTDVSVSFAWVVTVRDCKNLFTSSPLLSLGRLTRFSSREVVCSLSISLHTLNLALLSSSSLLSLNSSSFCSCFYLSSSRAFSCST